MTIDHLGLDVEKVNPKGGAIAVGHPLGATGGRLTATLLSDLHRLNKEVGIATLCCGTGFGKASLFGQSFATSLVVSSSRVMSSRRVMGFDSLTESSVISFAIRCSLQQLAVILELL